MCICDFSFKSREMNRFLNREDFVQYDKNVRYDIFETS